MRADLGRTALALRQRSVWEAWDAGILLWRQSAGASFLCVFLPAALLALGLRLLLAPLHPAWAWLAVWWMKPLLDRPFLFVLSRRFFRPDAGLAEASRGMWPAVLRGLPSDLSWRRFDPSRSTRMPLSVLEGARGALARERWKAMERQQGWSGAALTLLCLLLEALLLFGAVAFVGQIAAMDGTTRALWEALGGSKALEPALYAGFCLGMALVEPLYLSMGFSQYLNRRVGTEGWDIGLSFASFAARRGKPDGPPAAAFLLALALLGTVAVRPLAAEGAPRESLERVLESREFGWEEEGWGIRARRWGGERELPEGLPRLFAGSREFLGRLLRVVLLVLLGGVLAFLLILALARLRGWKPSPSGSPHRKRERAGAKVDAGALFERAAALAAEGRSREAWAACARGLLAAYAGREGLGFAPEATEGECLRQAAGKGARDAEVLRRHIGAWVRLAYAGRAPEDGAFEEALEWGVSLLRPAEAAS